MAWCGSRIATHAPSSTVEGTAAAQRFVTNDAMVELTAPYLTRSTFHAWYSCGEGDCMFEIPFAGSVRLHNTGPAYGRYAPRLAGHSAYRSRICTRSRSAGHIGGRYVTYPDPPLLRTAPPPAVCALPTEGSGPTALARGKSECSEVFQSRRAKTGEVARSAASQRENPALTSLRGGDRVDLLAADRQRSPVSCDYAQPSHDYRLLQGALSHVSVSEANGGGWPFRFA